MDKISDVLLSIRLENDLTTTCRRRLPYECCGIIYGSLISRTLHAESFSLIRNISANPLNSFVFDPVQWSRAYLNAQKNQRAIVGLFHSHPSGSALPSNEDIKGWLPEGTYWIVSFAEGRSNISVYQCSSSGEWTNLKLQRLLG